MTDARKKILDTVDANQGQGDQIPPGHRDDPKRHR